MDKPRKPFKRQGGPSSARPSKGPRGNAAGPGDRRDRPPPPRREYEGDAARDRVCRALAEQFRRYPDMVIDALDTVGLSPRDAAFAHAIYDTAIRRWGTLWAMIEWKLERPGAELPPKAAAALLAGTVQIILFDKVPIHAAVDTSVEWAKRNAGISTGGLINAVLRGVASLIPEGGKERREKYTDLRDELPMPDGTALVVAHHIFSADPLQRLAAATSCPIELLRSWAKNRGMRETRRLALHGLMSPPIILNTAHATSPLPPNCIPHSCPGHHIYTGEHHALLSLLKSRRDIWAQDPASALAITSVSDLKPGLIVDACAGRGTKTRQLAAMFPDAKIIAADVDLPRMKTLRDAVAGQNITVVPYQSLTDYAGQADLILLDVPCSNTGVLARRIEARYRFDREHLDKLAAAQRQIIADSIRLLREGTRSRILYSTCSLDPEENQEQAKWIARWHGMRIAREHERIPEGQPGDPDEKYTDGSYAVLME